MALFEKFGEFDSAEEINRAAAAQLAEGDTDAIYALAKENGIDMEEVDDYIDGVTTELCTTLMAANGKLKVEEKELGIKGVLIDWKNGVEQLCLDDEAIAKAVRKKGKSLRDCMAALIKFSFENKVEVSGKIVEVTKVLNHGKLEQLRGPLYLGVPNRAEAKRIITDYYMGR